MEQPLCGTGTKDQYAPPDTDRPGVEAPVLSSVQRLSGPGVKRPGQDPPGTCDHHLSWLWTPVTISGREVSTMNRKSFQDLKPTIWIGKRGITGDMIDEIRRQLKDRKVVKVRWLRNTEVNPDEIAASADADLLEVRGRTLVLAERRGRSACRSSRNI